MQQQQYIWLPSMAFNPQPFSGIVPQIILIFGAPQYFADAKEIQQLQASYPQAILIGCSTAGEIGKLAVHDNSLIINAIEFSKTQAVAVSTLLNNMEDSQEAGKRIANQFNQQDLKAVLVLGPGVNINGSALIEGIKTNLPPEVKVTGGLAGDNGGFQATYTVLNQQIATNQIVALGLYGEHVQCYHGSFGGWQPFGPARKVTRSVNNILYELDGEPALSVYKRYLGDYASGLPASGLLFPFAMLDNSQSQTGLIRTILGINEEDGSLTLAGDIIEHGYLELMHASTDALVDGAQAAADAAHAMFANPDVQGLAVLISCIGRKLVMGARVDEEIEAVADVFGEGSLVTGFYSYGEISPFVSATDCKLHNQTMTITYISEI